MRFHCIKHVPFEGPEKIQHRANERKEPFTISHAWDHSFPSVHEFDVLVLMGGPMSANDDGHLSWMKKEKRLIEEALREKKPILGVCLGAQLVASVLGATVKPNPTPEIGWFPLTMTPESRNWNAFRRLPTRFTPFHWHGETFSLPAGSVRMASSDVCENQGFLFEERVLGLQFHMEGTAGSLIRMMEESRNEMIRSPAVQSEEEIRRGVKEYLDPLAPLFRTLMDDFFGSLPRPTP